MNTDKIESRISRSSNVDRSDPKKSKSSNIDESGLWPIEFLKKRKKKKTEAT